MDHYSQHTDGWEKKGQYPTEEDIVDPYLNDETVGVPPVDQVRHHENNFHPFQEEQELEQRGRHSDDAMDQNPGSLGAFNIKITQPGRSSSFDPRSLVSQIPEMDKEGVHTGREGGALQPPAMLEFAGLGRNGSVYYKAGPPRRSGALRKNRAPQISEKEEDNSSKPAQQVELGAHGGDDRPPPGQDRLDQQRVSEASLYGGNNQPRMEPSSMAHPLAAQAPRSGQYPSVPEALQLGVAHNPQAAQAMPGSKPMGRPNSSSMSPESRQGFHPQEHTSLAPGSHVSPPLQGHQATVPQGAPQRAPPQTRQPQRQGQTASMPDNRSRSPQQTPPQMQQRAPVTPNPTGYAQGVHPPSPVSSPSPRPKNLPGSQARQSAVPLPKTAQSTPSGQQSSRTPQMAGPQQAQDPQQRAAQQQQQSRPPAMVPLQPGQQPSRKPVPPTGRSSQPSSAQTQGAATQRPPRGQESYEPHGMQQQQRRQSPSSRQQQGAPSSTPYGRTPRPGGSQQPQQIVPGNSSTTPMEKQQGSMDQPYSPPLHEMAASAPSYDRNVTARPQRDQQTNNPSEAYGAVEPVLAPQRRQPPAEPYGRPKNFTNSPPPQPATMNPSQQPLGLGQPPASIPNESVTDDQIPSSSSSTQPPAQRRSPLRTQPGKPPSPAPLTGESLLSTFMQGRPVPRLDARDPNHGSALMEATVAGGLALGHAWILPDHFRESVQRAGGLEEHVKGLLNYPRRMMGPRV